MITRDRLALVMMTALMTAPPTRTAGGRDVAKRSTSGWPRTRLPPEPTGWPLHGDGRSSVLGHLAGLVMSDPPPSLVAPAAIGDLTRIAAGQFPVMLFLPHCVLQRIHAAQERQPGARGSRRHSQNGHRVAGRSEVPRPPAPGLAGHHHPAGVDDEGGRDPPEFPPRDRHWIHRPRHEIRP